MAKTFHTLSTVVSDHYYAEWKDQKPIRTSIARNARAGSKYQTNIAGSKTALIITSPLLIFTGILPVSSLQRQSLEVFWLAPGYFCSTGCQCKYVSETFIVLVTYTLSVLSERLITDLFPRERNNSNVKSRTKQR